MAFVTPVRGGSNPAAATPTVMYTALANATVYVKISNTSATVAAGFVIWNDQLGGGTTTDDEIEAAGTIPPGDFLLVGPIVMLDTDELVVFATTADVAFRYGGLTE